jgi:hypothetical protein
MFELARAYKLNGMTAYSRLQEKEFSREQCGYEAVKHQRFAGTGYFDAVQQVITGGTASTTALQGSTETAQFSDKNLQPHSEGGQDAGGQPSLGECPLAVEPTNVASKHIARELPERAISAV